MGSHTVDSERTANSVASAAMLVRDTGGRRPFTAVVRTRSVNMSTLTRRYTLTKEAGIRAMSPLSLCYFHPVPLCSSLTCCCLSIHTNDTAARMKLYYGAYVVTHNSLAINVDGSKIALSFDH